MQKQEDIEAQHTFKPPSQKFQIYATLKLDSINSLQIFQDTIRIEFINRQIDWRNILAINAYQQSKILSKIEIILFSKQKKLFKGIVRCQEQIQFYVMPESVEDMLFKVRRFITHSQIDKPKFLIFHNPISGSDSKGKLLKGLEFISKTHFQIEVITTKYRGHCKEYLLENKPTREQYWGVAIFSGDGLMHEFVNSRNEIPVIHIPSGSGNAFAKNQAVLANEECGVEQNLFIAMKGLVTKTPLIELQLQKVPQKLYSTLNVQWAFLSDIDMQSQFLRCLGTLRFQVYSYWRIIFLRTYRGIFSFSETDADLPNLNQPITSPSFQTRQIDVYNFLLLILPYIGQKYHCAPLINSKSEFIDLQINPAESGWLAFFRYMTNFQKGTQFDLENRKPKFNFQHNLIKSFRLQPLGEARGRLGIDGEEYDSQKIQGRWIPDALNIFTLY